jgi:hypothetical protein
VQFSEVVCCSWGVKNVDSRDEGDADEVCAQFAVGIESGMAWSRPTTCFCWVNMGSFPAGGLESLGGMFASEKEGELRPLAAGAEKRAAPRKGPGCAR